jgi:hypothetical protein
MTPKQDETIKSIAVIGNYLLRQCGIATIEVKKLIQCMRAVT